MFRKIKGILFNSNFSRAQLKTVLPQIMEENRKFGMIWSVVNELFWMYCLIMTMLNPLYHACLNIYIVAFVISAAALALFVRMAPKRPRVTQLLSIVLDEVLLLAGIFIARHLAPRTILVFASVLIVPVVFITESFSTILMLTVNVLVFILIGSRSMDGDTYGWVLSNLCIFSVVGVMIGHFVNKARFERFIFSNSNAELAEIQARYARYDELTNLQNRRAFAETLDQFTGNMPADCRVVMADINGLKETNDALGHHAGDELIRGAAECLRQSFPGMERIYRIGGDEFSIILLDREYDVESATDRLQKCCREWNGEFVKGISLAVGVASAEGYADMDSVIKAADQKMYALKRNYYENSGRDRRRRRSEGNPPPSEPGKNAAGTAGGAR